MRPKGYGSRALLAGSPGGPGSTQQERELEAETLRPCLPAPAAPQYSHCTPVAEGGRALLPKEDAGSAEHGRLRLGLLQRGLQRMEQGHGAHLQKGRGEEGSL